MREVDLHQKEEFAKKRGPERSGPQGVSPFRGRHDGMLFKAIPGKVLLRFSVRNCVKTKNASSSRKSAFAVFRPELRKNKELQQFQEKCLCGFPEVLGGMGPAGGGFRRPRGKDALRHHFAMLGNVEAFDLFLGRG
ncbi:hypothetical protein EOA30_33755, partial [Mesorhizobium sp. M8A.F.Ca.ET.059.01.1.1]